MMGSNMKIINSEIEDARRHIHALFQGSFSIFTSRAYEKPWINT